MAARKTHPKAGIATPLTIIASLLGLCDLVAGIAATQIKEGWSHSALILFTVLFPVVVAVGFFFILWKKNYVLYPPSEYGGDPRSFVEAMKHGGLPAVQQQLVEQAESDAESKDQLFSAISALVDSSDMQLLILMYEQSITLLDSAHFSFKTISINGWRIEGSSSAKGFGDKMIPAGLVQIRMSNEVPSARAL